MYSIYQTEISDLTKRLRKKGDFYYLKTSQQKKIFASEVESVKVITSMNKFQFAWLCFMWFKTYTSCLITLKNGEKLFIEVSLKDINDYFSDFLI